MSIVDENLIANAERIENYFKEVNKENREKISVDLLPIIRSLCESIMYKIYDLVHNCDLYQTQENLTIVRKYIKENNKDVYDFHCQLDAGPGHNFVTNKNAESLVLKYLPYLFKLKEILKNISGIEILKSLKNYPLDIDESLISFYEKIYILILSVKDISSKPTRNLYFVRKKSFKCINGKMFYEYVMDASDDGNNKFNTFVVYSLKNIRYNYDLRFNLLKREMRFLDTNITINILNDYEYYIRPCCFYNLLFLINYGNKRSKRTNEYKNIMSIIKNNNVSLYEIVMDAKYMFNNDKDFYHNFINICREFLKTNTLGTNLIKFLLCSMRNDVIKAQQSYNKLPNDKFNKLRICTGSLSFEIMPYAFNPKKAITNIDLLNKIIQNNEYTESEIFYSSLVKYINEKNELFVKPNDIGYTEIDALKLSESFNKELLYKNNYYNDHRIINKNGHYTIEFYYNETIEILKFIKENDKSDIIFNETTNLSLSNEQKEIINHCFNTSRIVLVNGSAGTGKTTIIKEIIKNNNHLKILCLTITNTALNNLKNKDTNVYYSNFENFEINKKSIDSSNYDLIIIDEASFVPTNNIYNILTKFNLTNILIVGDTEQIESIEFGNWFKLAINIFKKEKYVYLLNNTYRSDSEALKRIWNEVRNNHSEKLLELLQAFNMSSKLTNYVFNYNDNEVVLCLNYDGLYGINNVNRYLQSKNLNKNFLYQQNIYKINDPVIFVVNEYDVLGIYNNLKGKIVEINDSDTEIEFAIEVDKLLNSLHYKDIIIDKIDENKSLVKIKKQKEYSDDDDTDINLKTKLPFQVSYAMSIHKAQGLEFDNVKIIITKESDEQIKKNIFYTAITRAKKNLKIFWEPEVAKEISDILSKNDASDKKDISILNQILKNI